MEHKVNSIIISELMNLYPKVPESYFNTFGAEIALSEKDREILERKYQHKLGLIMDILKGNE